MSRQLSLLSRRQFVRNAATGLLVPTMMSEIVRGSVPLPLGFFKSAAITSGPSIPPNTIHSWYTREHTGNNVSDGVGSVTLVNHGGTFVSDGVTFLGAQWLDTAAWSGGSNNVSFLGWWKLGDVTSGQMLIEKDAVNSHYEVLVLTTIVLRGGAGPDLSTPSTVSSGVWHQIVCTINGTAGAIYIDGSSVASGTTGSFTETSTVLNVGRYNSGYYVLNPATCGLVQIANVAWSAGDVSTAWTNQRSLFGV